MKRKLLIVTVALLCSVGVWADTDYTSSVKTGKDDWNGASGTYTPHTLDVQMVERYTDGLTAAGTIVFTQTVTGLSAGTYTVVLYATANNARNNDGIKSDAQDIAYVYAGSDKSHKAYVLSHYQEQFVMPHIYALNNVTVGADGNLEIGMYTEKTGTQWQTIQIKSLTKVDAVAEPDVTKKVTVGGSAVSNTDAFTSIAATSTLEVGATAFMPIHFTNASEAFTYTPETTCTVRFVRTGGNIYVYEGTTYKGVVATFTPTLYTTFAADYRPTNKNQLLQNPDFDTKGDALNGGNAWKVGTPWTSNVTWGNSSSGIRVRENSDKVVFLWRGSGNNNYFGQPLSTLKPNTQYRVMLQQIASGNSNATFYIGIGSSVGTHGLCEKSFTLGTNQDGVKNGNFTTPASIVNGTTYHFTFQNSSWNSASDGSDPVTQIDWISLEEPYTWALTGVSSASYLDGTAYKPYTLSEIRAEFATAYASLNTNLNDATYTNVTGTERTALETAYNTTYKSYSSESLTDYETAIATINGLIETFTGAKSEYDRYAAEKANADRIATSIASGIDAPTTAEGCDAVINSILVAEYNYVSNTSNFNAKQAEAYNLGLGNWESTATSDGGKADTRQTHNNEHWSGSTVTYYEQGANGWGKGNWVVNYTKSVTLPAGTYVLRLAARASYNTTATMKVTIGETAYTEALPSKGAATKGVTTSGVASFDEGTFANTAGRGWQWRYLAFTVDEEASVRFDIDASATPKNEWCSFCDVELYSYVSTAAMETALSGFTLENLGYEKDQYAPYNNVAILEAYASATAIQNGTQAPGTQAEVDEITSILTSPSWSVNATDVNAIYDGNFKIQEEHTASPTALIGWTEVEGIRQLIKNTTTDVGLASLEEGSGAVFAWGNTTLTYGEKTGYTLPLAAHTIYELSLKVTGWRDSNLPTAYYASVLYNGNGLANGNILQQSVTKRVNEEDPFVDVSILFATGEAGNYILTLNSPGYQPAVISDIKLQKAASQTLTLPSATQYAAGTYPAVALSRTFASTSNWYTLCAPFDFPKTAFEEVKVLDSVTDNAGDVNMTFTDAGSTISAGTPCLVKPASADATLCVENVPINPAASAGSTVESIGTTTVTYVGTFENTVINGSSVTNAWVVSDNALYHVAEGHNATVGAYRAYFTVATGGTVKALSYDFGNADGIRSIDNGQLTIDNDKVIYNLAGQKMNKLQKGVYIVNGKKVLVK